MYQVATLAEYKREAEEDLDNDQKINTESTEQMIDMSKATSLEEWQKQASEFEESVKNSQKASGNPNKTLKKLKEPQFLSPWLFLFGWQRVNNTPQLRLTAGRDSTIRQYNGGEDEAFFASQSFDSLARSQNYQLSYTNFSKGGMSGGPVMDTLGRVIGIHAAAEADRSGLEEIYLGFSFGIPTKTVLSSSNQTGIKPEWLKVEKVRPPRITKADEQSIAKNLLEIEPPGKDATEADWLNYGNELWRINRYREATAAFDEAIKRKPDFYQAYFGKALVIQKQEAERLLAQSFEGLLPDFSSLEASFEESTQDLDTLSQEINEQNKQTEQFSQKQTQALTSMSQRQAKALPFLKKATEINPDFYPAWREIGRIKYLGMTQKGTIVRVNTETGKVIPNPPLSPKDTLAAKESLAAFNKATALNPSDNELYNRKGDLLQQLSRHQEAIDAYSEGIKINPTPMLYFMRSTSYCAIGDKQKAEADLKSAEKLGYQNAAKDVPVCSQGQGFIDYYN
jgi:tetratricopeptide (TPR) repeat protein